MHKLTLLAVLTLVLSEEIKFTDLGDKSLFIEDIQKVFLYHNQVKLIVGVDTSVIQQAKEKATDQLSKLNQLCKQSNCRESAEINVLKIKINTLESKFIHYKNLMHLRVKRGLFNFVGSISKTLFGTLDNSDLNLINQNMDKLFDTNNKMTQVVKNQTLMIKNVLKLSNVEQLSEKILETEDFALNIIGLESFIYQIIEQIDTTVTAILIGKQGIIHPDILTNEQFLLAYTKLIKESNMYNALEPVEGNVQLIYDISNIKINLKEAKIVYIIDIPILETTEWILRKYYPIPKKTGTIFSTINIPETHTPNNIRIHWNRSGIFR